MYRVFIAIIFALLAPLAGCADSSDKDAAASGLAAKETVAQTSASERPSGGASAGAVTSTTDASDSDPTSAAQDTSDATASEEPAVGTQPISDSPENDGLKNFEAGIAAYQGNNLPLAFQEFSTAAAKGHADSQYNLALMYEQGIGTVKDDSQAVAWYAKSAAQGNSAAQFNLGVLYENGRGTKVDFAKANKWYRSASVQGDPLAIGNLGMLYIRGDGVPENKVAGVALLFMSATMDPSPSNNARRNITSTRGLSAEMIGTAQQLSGELGSAKDMLATLDQFLAKSAKP